MNKAENDTHAVVYAAPEGVPDGFYGHLHTEADNKYPPEASTTAMSLTLRSNFLGSNGQKQNV